MQNQFMRKMAMLMAGAATLSAATMTPSYADDSAYLQQIAQNTANILTAVNNIPTYINQVLQYVLNMQKTDTSQTTKNMQNSFAITGQSIVQNANTQLGLEAKLNATLLPNITTTSLPYANDLVYSTLLGQPFFNPDPRSKGPSASVNAAYNYIVNAGGLNLSHAMPQPVWHGSQYYYQQYANYYNTVIAVESFGGYVLANQYADAQNNNGLSQSQLSLVSQASSSDWIATIASEEMGKVFRQLLMFESQLYVLMTQVLQTEKQLLTAQVMTNALLIANNQMNEDIMASKAQGVPIHT